MGVVERQRQFRERSALPSFFLSLPNELTNWAGQGRSL